MNLKKPAAIILLILPVIIPPYLQYRQILSAPAALGLIIVLYLPIYFYFRYRPRLKKE